MGKIGPQRRPASYRPTPYRIRESAVLDCGSDIAFVCSLVCADDESERSKLEMRERRFEGGIYVPSTQVEVRSEDNTK